MLVSELEQSQEQPGNTSETFMSSQDHSDGARLAPYVEILKIVSNVNFSEISGKDFLKTVKN